jgi:hypothetical protein
VSIWRKATSSSKFGNCVNTSIKNSRYDVVVSISVSTLIKNPCLDGALKWGWELFIWKLRVMTHDVILLRQCSKKCGGGFKTREIFCKQILALGQILDRPLAHCSGSGPRPASRKHCNTRACSSRKKPRIRGNPTQNYVQDSPMSKISLKIGGRATVFLGTTIKIKCSVKHYDRWALHFFLT